MKSLFRVLIQLFGIAALGTNSFAQSGWYPQSPLPQTLESVLRAVATPDLSTVIAAGDRGTILSTTDGGATWMPQSSGSTSVLGGLSFVDIRQMLAVPCLLSPALLRIDPDWAPCALIRASGSSLSLNENDINGPEIWPARTVELGVPFA